MRGAKTRCSASNRSCSLQGVLETRATSLGLATALGLLIRSFYGLRKLPTCSASAARPCARWKRGREHQLDRSVFGPTPFSVIHAGERIVRGQLPVDSN